MRMKYYSDKQIQLSRQHFQRAIDLVGNQSKLACELSTKMGKTIYQAHVRKWLKITNVIPDYICAHIEEITNGEVKKSDLRPDLWPADKESEAA